MNWFTQTHYTELHTLLTGLTRAVAGQAHQLTTLNQKVDKMALDTSKLTADVAALKSAVATAITDLGALSTDIAALKAQIAAGGDPAAQAAIDQIDKDVTGITSDLTTATAANPA